MGRSGSLAFDDGGVRQSELFPAIIESELEKETRLPLGDFDVLAQMAVAGGSLRMTELAA